MSNPGPSLRHYRELDGVRGIAALAVFFHHVCNTGIHTPPVGGSFGALAARAVFNASEYGFYGVDVFFVLSGFLITSLLIKDREAPSYYKDFYWKRALRILPMYLLCSALVLWLFHDSWKYVLISLVFLSNYAGIFHIVAYAPFWSLSIEEQFYVLWPTVVRKIDPEKLERWAGGLWVATIVARLVMGQLGHYNYSFTPLRADGLASGAFLACRQHLRGRQSGLAGDATALSLAMVAGVALLGLGYGMAWMPAELQANFKETGIILAAAGFIGLLVGFTNHRRLAVFRAPVLLFYGMLSYALYMTHSFVMYAIDKFYPDLAHLTPEAYWTRFAVGLGCTTALCILTRYAVELPAISLRRFVLSRPTPPPESALPLAELAANE